tara:strand:+ start:6305 stop:6448 length:144 start_codon:yes stop_codon:yes gene_type:complete
MGWGNCEDHYSRIAKQNEKLKPMEKRTKLIIIGWTLFGIGVIWTFLK